MRHGEWATYSPLLTAITLTRTVIAITTVSNEFMSCKVILPDNRVQNKHNMLTISTQEVRPGNSGEICERNIWVLVNIGLLLN